MKEMEKNCELRGVDDVNWDREPGIGLHIFNVLKVQLN